MILDAISVLISGIYLIIMFFLFSSIVSTININLYRSIDQFSLYRTTSIINSKTTLKLNLC